MKKNVIRLLSLMICAVMVLGMVPGKANAVELDGVQLPQMQAINFDETSQTYFITEFADLLYLADVAANNPDIGYEIVYSSYERFVIDQDITFGNMSFQCEGPLLIPAGVTVTVEDYRNFDAQKMTVDGTLDIKQFGSASAIYLLDINGVVNLEGTLHVYEDTDFTGTERINYMDNGMVHLTCFFDNGEELQEIVDMANASTLPWQYIASNNSNTIHISSPIVLPENVSLRISRENFHITGATITINGESDFYASGECVIENDLIVNGVCNVGCYFNTERNMRFTGDVTNNYSLRLLCDPVIFEGAVKNNFTIQIKEHPDGYGKAIFMNPDLYNDQTEPGGGPYGDGSAIIGIIARESDPPENAVVGLDMNDFQKITFDEEYDVWFLSNYRREEPSEPTEPSDPTVHEHSVVTDAAVAPTCLTSGLTEGAHCATCGEVFVKQETLAPLGHYYGLDDNGKIDFYDEDCDVCGAKRVVDPNRLTHSMYRLYNPNTGEHFYTGSMEERQTLEVAGWKFEGVGFTFPANTGAPVYRLFQPSTGEHLYTMDENEVAMLVAQGWTKEGVAFNSGNESEVPQYRLYNPNVTVGAYHFTADANERAALLAAGWWDQGIGFYSCWQ